MRVLINRALTPIFLGLLGACATGIPVQEIGSMHVGGRPVTLSGLPVRDIPPQGAIYLSVQFALRGRQRGVGIELRDQFSQVAHAVLGGFRVLLRSA